VGGRPEVATAISTLDRVISFEDLFRSEYARVVSIARRVVGDPASAEDVAQEVFTSFARRMGPGDPRAGAWLYTTAIRKARNAARGRQRREARERRDGALAAAYLQAIESERDPQRSLDRVEVQALVRKTMLRLPERSAMLLALRYGGCSYREIALALALPEDQVGTYLARAQRAFRKEYLDGSQS